MKGYAIVTGASKGIGKAIAAELAQKGWPLVLVARTEHLLQELAETWTKAYGVAVEYCALDLCEPESPARLLHFCEEKGIQPKILVNNAGFGVWGKFADNDWKDLHAMNQLNVTALLQMCHAFIPQLKAAGGGHILNVASTGAFTPIPNMALYGAGKAYVRSFSYALREELKPHGIWVTCLSPGGTWTEFMDRAGNQIVAERASKWMMPAEACAKAALKGMFKGKAEVIPGWYNRLAAWASKHAPTGMTARTAGKMFEE